MAVAALIHLIPYYLLFQVVAILVSFTSTLPTVNSLSCTSQTLKKANKAMMYTNCTDLPTLSSYLHWTYDSSKSSLTIAFLAPPAKSDGWVAWAINPTAAAMIGSQALIAFKKSDGSLTLKTYNLTSYSSITQSKLLYKVSDSSAEYSGGLMAIFATLELPENTTMLNQVWQVGSAVVDGVPAKHAFAPENLGAKGTLELVKAAAAHSNGTTSTSTGNTTTTTAAAAGNNKSNDGLMITGNTLWFHLSSFFITSTIFAF